MGAVLYFFLNVLVIAGTIVPFLVAAMLIVYRTTRVQERLLRGLAMFTAALMVLGLHAAGLTVGHGVVDTLEAEGARGLLIKLAWILGAGLIGTMGGRYLSEHLLDSTSVQIRVMVFIGTVAHLELLEIYVSSFHRNGFAVGAGAIPVIAFICGFLMYLVLMHDPDAVRKIRSGLPGRSPGGREADLGFRQRVPPLIPNEEYTDIFGENS